MYLHICKGICMLVYTYTLNYMHVSVYMYTLFMHAFDAGKNIHFYVLLQHLDVQACIYIQEEC